MSIQYQPYLNDTNCSKVCPCAPSVVIQLYMYSALMPRSRNLPCNYFLSGDNLIDELIGAYGEELRKQVKKPSDGRYVTPGVYVFQGGKGGMSLIVTPGYEQVILIDGTSNAECFIAAWNSIL